MLKDTFIPLLRYFRDSDDDRVPFTVLHALATSLVVTTSTITLSYSSSTNPLASLPNQGNLRRCNVFAAVYPY